MLTVDKLAACLSEISPATLSPGGRLDWYFVSYPSFIRKLQAVETIERDDVISAIGFVYSWMPTIPSLHIDHTSDLAAVRDIIRKARRGGCLDDAEMLTIKKVVNNSLVGTSKLLHLFCPEQYPMWDSNICRLFRRMEYDLADLKSYKGYVKYCLEITSQAVRQGSSIAGFDDVRRELKRLFPDIRWAELADLRVADFSLWLISTRVLIISKDRYVVLTDDIVETVWNRATRISGVNPRLFRKDPCGARICRPHSTSKCNTLTEGFRCSFESQTLSG